MRLRLLTALICLAALGPRPAWSQTSASAPMTGTVLTAITITGSDLGFGALLSTQSKRVAAPAGGRFVVTMAAATPVTIAYAFPAALGPGVTLSAWELLSNTLNDPASAQAITVSAGAGSFTASTATGNLYLWIGATVTTTNAGIGSYSQPITLTVTYN
jgi:hypothetical protein